MREPTRDPGLDTLLELHGETMFVDDIGHWVKFVVVQTEVTPERPHGLSYLVDAARAGWRQAGWLR